MDSSLQLSQNVSRVHQHEQEEEKQQESNNGQVEETSTLLQRKNSLNHSAIQPMPMIRRVFHIQGVPYTYQGPDHQQIQDLFNILDEKQHQPSRFHTLDLIREYTVKVESWFKLKCSFFNEQIIITPYIVFITTTYLIMYIVYLFDALALNDDSTVSQSSIRLGIAQLLPEYGIMFTMFSLGFLYVENQWIIMICCIGAFITPLVLIVFVYLNAISIFEDPNYDVTTIVLLGFISGTFLNSFLTNMLYRWIKSLINDISSALLVAGWCILIPYFVGSTLIMYVLSNSSIQYNSIMSFIITKLYIPLLIILITSWIIIKARLFNLSTSAVTSALERIKHKLTKKYLEAKQSRNYSSWIIANFNEILAYMIGALYIVSEIWIFVELAVELTKDSQDYTTVIALSFEVIAIPLFLIIGIYIAVSNRGPQETFLLMPFIFGAAPTFGCIKLANALADYTNISALLGIIQAAPVLLTSVWLTLALYGVERRKLFLYMFGIMCYFFAFPIGVLLPLYNMSQNSLFQYSAYVLIIFGLLFITGIFMYYIYQSFQVVLKVKRIADQNYPQFGEFVYYNLTEYAYWLNAIFFIISYFIICYFYWNSSDTTSTDVEVGTLIALLVIHPIIFTLINVALGAPSLEIKDDFVNDSNVGMVEEITNERKEQLRKMQNTVTIVGIVTPLIVCIPLSFMTSNEKYNTGLLGIAFGVPLSFIFYKALLIVKNESSDYQNFFQPFVSSLGWCCVIFPFGVAVPAISNYLANTEDEFQIYAQVTVAAGLFICILGVTGTSLFLSILLNREEFEKKKREVMKKVMKVMDENHLISDLTILSQLFMKYFLLKTKLMKRVMEQKSIKQMLQKEQEVNKRLKNELTQQLIEGNPVKAIPYDGPEMDYDHQLVSRKFYLEMQAQKLKLETKKDEKLHPCLICLLDCLFCRCGLQEQDDLEAQKEKEILRLRDILALNLEDEEFKMNDILPGFDDVYKIDTIGTGLMAKIDLKPEQLILKDNRPYKPIQDIQSSKSAYLQGIVKKEPNEKAFEKIIQTEYYQGVKSKPEMLAEFLHEVFMEFANQEEGLDPSICYNDFKEFCRLSEMQFDISIYQRYANMPWLHQTRSLSEENFAALLKSTMHGKPGEPFENLRKFALDHIYPKLITSIKTLMINVKSNNRNMLQNKYDISKSPFMQNNFNDPKFAANPNATEKIIETLQVKNKLQVKTEAVEKNPKQDKKQRKKNKKELNYEYELQKQEIERKYISMLPWYKKYCYKCAACMRNLCCTMPSKCWDGLFGSFKPKQRKAKKQIDAFRQYREKMPKWEKMSDLAIVTMIKASDEYDLQLTERANQEFEFRTSFSNIMALVFRLVDLYSLAALAYNPQVDWFGSGSTINGTSTVEGSAFYDSYTFYFYLSAGLAVLYAILGRFAFNNVQDNSLGQDEEGNVAKFPHPQFLLTQSITILSGTFLLIMRSFIDAFVCDYTSFPYTLSRDDSVECMGDQHFVFIGISFIGIAIYYPLSTFLQPTFQYMDHSLDLKYKSTYFVIYIQCKLMILGLSTVFADLSDAFQYQLVFSSFIIIGLLSIHVKMTPCYVKWFNLLEQILLLIILSIYIGAFIIMTTGNYIIGLVFTAVLAGILLILVSYYSYRVVNTRKRAQVMQDPDVVKELKTTNKKQQKKIDVSQLVEDEQLKKLSKPQYQIIKPVDNDRTLIDQPIILRGGDYDVVEIQNIQDEINKDKVEVKKKDYNKIKI